MKLRVWGHCPYIYRMHYNIRRSDPPRSGGPTRAPTTATFAPPNPLPGTFIPKQRLHASGLTFGEPDYKFWTPARFAVFTQKLTKLTVSTAQVVDRSNGSM